MGTLLLGWHTLQDFMNWTLKVAFLDKKLYNYTELKEYYWKRKNADLQISILETYCLENEMSVYSLLNGAKLLTCLYVKSFCC